MPRDVLAATVAQKLDQRTCVLINQGSGRQTLKEDLGRIERAFSDQGEAVDVRVLSPRTDIQAQAAKALEDGFTTLVAGGGDGTICGVASAVIGQAGARLGVLPLGTFNYFGRSLHLPEDIASAVQVIVAGNERALDVGLVNGRLFLNNASLGAYPEILKTREGIYRSWGRSRAAAYWSVVQTLMQQRGNFRAEIVTDEGRRSLKAAMLMCVRNPWQLRLMDLEGADDVDEGKLALLIAPQRTPVQMIAAAARLLARQPQKHVDYEVVTGTKFTIIPRRKRQKLARDGEWHTEAGPFTFALHANPLRVLVPLPPPTGPDAAA